MENDLRLKKLNWFFCKKYTVTGFNTFESLYTINILSLRQSQNYQNEENCTERNAPRNGWKNG